MATVCFGCPTTANIEYISVWLPFRHIHYIIWLLCVLQSGNTQVMLWISLCWSKASVTPKSLSICFDISILSIPTFLFPVHLYFFYTSGTDCLLWYLPFLWCPKTSSLGWISVWVHSTCVICIPIFFCSLLCYLAYYVMFLVLLLFQHILICLSLYTLSQLWVTSFLPLCMWLSCHLILVSFHVLCLQFWFIISQI